tara:strand:+ start:1175 stop:1990 length:816 start_codon:yes stop_codon:yes gene_type:complete
MKIFKDRNKLKKEISGIKNLNFIPTMGSLHNGHKYLIQKARKNRGCILVSIFVNPKQFNSTTDYLNYPKNIKNDLKLLKRLKVDLIYLPNYKDIFSFKATNKIHLNKFHRKLCGKYRKKHFLGVVNIVNRFLELIKPKYMYLGKKDFQQLYLIGEHIKENKIRTKIIPCKTVREKNGIACSSRNNNLKKNELLIASKIYHFLKKEKNKLIQRKQYKFQIKNLLKIIKSMGIKKIDYIDKINIDNPNQKPFIKKFNIFIAYYIGKIRLIDNF